VIGVPDRLLGEAIKAFVVSADPADRPASEQLRAFTRAALAGSKAPAQWERQPGAGDRTGLRLMA
jgi:acyl-CoA synthetase (AMP-forming)/AMP-acid ligase II